MTEEEILQDANNKRRIRLMLEKAYKQKANSVQLQREDIKTLMDLIDWDLLEKDQARKKRVEQLVGVVDNKVKDQPKVKTN